MSGPLPLLTAAWLLGMLLFHPANPGIFSLLAVGVLALGVCLAARRSALAAMAFMAAAFVSGGLRASAGVPMRWGAPRVPTVTADRLVGEVLEGCSRVADRERCVVDVASRGRVLVSVPVGQCDALPGDVIEAVATFVPVAPLSNPPRVDSAEGLLRDGIYWRAVTAGCSITAHRVGVLTWPRALALRVRRSLSSGLSTAMGPTDSSRAMALLVGDTRGLDGASADAFRASGLAHLLAVSGAHVALFLSVAGWALRKVLSRITPVAVRGWAPRISTWLPLPLAGMFIAVTGESPASLRALFTGIVTAGATLMGRRAHPEATLALVALAMSAWHPALVHDLGWALSVVATWALVSTRRLTQSTFTTDTESSVLSFLRSVLRELTEALSATANVSFSIVPIAAWNFGQTPVTAVVMNLVAAPLGEAIALPLVLFTALCSVVSPSLGEALGPAAGFVLDVLWALPRVALTLPLATVRLPMPTPCEWVIATALVLIAVRLRWRARAVVFLVGIIALVSIEMFHRRAIDSRGVLRVTTLDVGQGDAVLLELPDGEAMLVDGGGALHGEPDPGARAVVPWLRWRRRESLAAVVLSHPHPDHAGGLSAVISTLNIKLLWDTLQGEALNTGGAYRALRSAARVRGVTVLGPRELCGARTWHGVRMEVLAPCPEAELATPPNDASFVLRVDYGRSSVLLPGDLEAHGERSLLSRMRPVTVLKIGHHGSRTSTTTPWLDALRPSVAMVSAGHPSPFGHPHPSVLERLRTRGVTVLRTDLGGLHTVSLRADGHWSIER